MISWRALQPEMPDVKQKLRKAGKARYLYRGIPKRCQKKQDCLQVRSVACGLGESSFCFCRFRTVQ